MDIIVNEGIADVASSMITAVPKAISRLAANHAKALHGEDAFTEQMASTRFSPIVLLDDTLRSQGDATTDVLQSALLLYTCHILTSVALNNQTQVRALERLDAINPGSKYRTDIKGSSIGNMSLSIESHQEGIPIYRQRPATESFSLVLDQPAYEANAPAAAGGNYRKGDKYLGKSNSIGARTDNAQKLNEDVNLSVGRVIEITLSEGDASVRVPVIAQLSVLPASPANLRLVMGALLADKSLPARIQGIRTGRLTAIGDGIFGVDLVKQHRDAMIKDKTGFYKEIQKRRTRSYIKTLMSGRVNIGQATNMLVISSDTLSSLENELGFRMSDARNRNKFFKSISGLLIAVMDPDAGMVTYYHAGIDLPSELSLKEVKNNNRKSGQDVTDLLRAFQLGNAPY